MKPLRGIAVVVLSGCVGALAACAYGEAGERPDVTAVDAAENRDIDATALPDATVGDTRVAPDVAADAGVDVARDTGADAARDAAVDAPASTDVTDAARDTGASVDAGPPTIDTPQRGSSSGGTAFRDVCAPGAYVIGFTGMLDRRGRNGQISAQCGLVRVLGATTLAVMPGAALPARGEGGGEAWTRLCPENNVVVGSTSRSGDIIDQLVVRCAPLTIAASTPAGVTLAIGAATNLPPTGGTGGTANPTDDCPAGRVAVGANVRAGGALDAFGLICAVPVAL